MINSQPVDPTSSEGYSLVAVTVFSWDTANLTLVKEDVIRNLGPHVEVVSADVFTKLVEQNVKH